MAIQRHSLKNLSKNPNFWLAVILFFAFLIRLIYFTQTTYQAMWWDEAEYMSAAKHWGIGVPYQLNEQRPPIFQLFGAILIKLGLGESALKFMLSLLPSLVLVVATYYLGKELFNSQVALIGALGTGFVWSLIFWSLRFQPDFFSVTLQIMAFLFFWKFIKKPSNNSAIYTGLFCAAAFYFKISALLVPLCMGLFLLYKDGWKIVKDKNNWVILGAFLVGLIPFMIWQLIKFGNPFAFGVTYSGDFNEGRSLGWMVFNFFYSFKDASYSFPKLLFFLFFLFGLMTFLSKKLISFDLVLKDKSLRSDGQTFSFIVLLVVSAFYLFYIRGTIEDRWVFIIIPFIFFFAGESIIYIKNKINNHSKIFSLLFLFVVIALFLFSQIGYANNLIKSKKDTYYPIKDSSLLIKENSDPSEKILSISYTQATAYSEREIITYSDMPLENFTKILNEKRPSYIMVSLWEPHHPAWILQQVSNEEGYQGTLFPYFNSSIIISPQGQLVQYDVKNNVSNDFAEFTLFYPVIPNEYNGVLVYKIDYKS